MKMLTWKMSLLLLLLVTVCNCAIIQTNSTSKLVEADSLTDLPIVSFGLISTTIIDETSPDVNRMTIGPTTNVENPNLAKQIITDKSLKVSTVLPNTDDNASSIGIDSSLEVITLSSSSSTSSPSPSPLSTSTSTEKRETISNEPETEQESTDERPPALPTINENADDTSLPFGDYSTPYTHPLETSTAQHESIDNKQTPLIKRKLKTGLYRIKLAEIITDQYTGDNIEQPGAESYHSSTPKNFEVLSESKLLPNQQNVGSGGGKINIADLYPIKMGDFNPIIKESNEKLIKAKDDYLRDSHSEQTEYDDDKNQLPNSLSGMFKSHDSNNADGKFFSTSNKTPDVDNNFTGKLLHDDDGVITEIEKKFQLDDLRHIVAVKSSSKSTTTAPTSTAFTKIFTSITKPIAVNHKIEFIDRRVKKSFDFPMHKYERQLDFGRIDFANTNFKTEIINNPIPDTHPEFSTTKFYNSKELYNEMLHKKHTLTTRPYSNSPVIGTMDPNPLPGTRLGTDNIRRQVIEMQIFGANNSTQQNNSSTQNMRITTPATTKQAMGVQKPKTRMRSQQEQKMSLTSQTKASASSEMTSTQKYETASGLNDDETTPYLRRHANVVAGIGAKSSGGKQSVEYAHGNSNPMPTDNNVKSMQTTRTRASSTSPVPTATTDLPPSSSAAASASLTSSSLTSSSSPSSSSSSTLSSSSEIATVAMAKVQPVLDDFGYLSLASPSSSTPLQALKPISRPRVLTRLQEKINSLECDIQNLPQGSHVWRGNETHELMLPTMTPENCRSSECMPMVISWEGQAEIQSGDVLLVEINDSLLYPTDNNQTFANVAHTTLVYQVTRPGHEHCDITEGVLLDITPLVVDGKKLVTLYDKDLTEGINLLIVVSELWGAQCIRLKVTVKSDNCGENADCSAKGVCFSNDSMEGYECQCCSGFAGPHCEEIDACSPSPCTNNGICVDLSQGHEGNAYQCLCPYGYTGKNCQYESDPCNPVECLNGGSCVGNSTHFRCDCAPGYTGPLCQHNLNECESSPCVHGICVDQEDGFRCFCQPGFAGELCDFEYNECESSPCLNGAECIDQIGGFECKCSKGYTGNRCQIKVDFCANRPCPDGHRCIDHGNDFSCECPGGRDGPDCNQIPRTQCNVNPCANGGTCWTSGDSFYCACRPGYTGKMCEDEFVVETVVSSSEFMVDDTNARDFTDKSFGTVVLKSPVELHNAYIAAGVLAAAIFIVAIVVTICHCKVNQTYRKFSNRQTAFFPILGFGKRSKSQKSNRHWLSGKCTNNTSNSGSNTLKSNKGHLAGTGSTHYHNHPTGGSNANGGGCGAAGYNCGSQLQQHGQSIHDRPFQRHLAMNLENDMYYTVDFSESQHSPLIQ